MIEKSELQDKLLALTEAELKQAHKTYERFLNSAKPVENEPVESDEYSQAVSAAEMAEALDDLEDDAQAKLAAIHDIDFGIKNVVEPGAAVLVGDRFMVVAVSTNEFECQNQTFIGISQAAPIYDAIEGKSAGDVVEFRGRKLQIKDVF